MLAAILISSVFAASNDPFAVITDREAIRSEAVQDLIVDLAGDPKKGRQAAIRLVKFGKVAVPSLVRALKSPDHQVRFYAASALDLIPHPAATEALYGILENEAEDPALRKIAVRTMGRSGHVQSVPALLAILLGKQNARGGRSAGGAPSDARPDGASDAPARLLESSPLAADEDYRFEVIRSLSYIGDPSAEGILAEATQDSSPRIREVAAQGLGDMVAAGGIGQLRKLLSDPENRVAAAAARALGKCGKLASIAVADLVASFDHPNVNARRNVRGALAIITGHSFSTHGRWKRWLDAMREEEKREAQSPPEDLSTIPLEGLAGSDGDPSGDAPSAGPRRPGSAPPALRPPWEWGDTRRKKDSAE